MGCKNCGKENSFWVTLTLYKCKECGTDFCQECGVTKFITGMECPKCGSSRITERDDE